MLGAPLSRRNEMSARRPLLRPGAAHDALDSFGFRLGYPRRHSVARRNRRSRSAGVRLRVRRLPVRPGRERSVQRKDRKGPAEQQPGYRFEIIPAAHLRLALGAEIARPEAETRLHRVPAFGAKVSLVEDDSHRSLRAVYQNETGLSTPNLLLSRAKSNNVEQTVRVCSCFHNWLIEETRANLDSLL